MKTMRVLVVALAMLASAVALRGQEIAFTWDDLPVHSALPAGETREGIARKILAAMKVQNLPPVYGFVNAVRMEQEPGTEKVLDMWRAEGLPLGNHTWSHMNLNQHTLEDWEADVLNDEPILRKEMEGADWHWLRYPNLAEGDTPEKKAGARAFLAQHGYKVAAVTMSFGDYLWNDPYARCMAKADGAAVTRLEASYLATADRAFDASRTLSKAVNGRDIPYVLLMHVGAFDARMLPRLLALCRAKGVRFVTLEEAEKDEFYRIDTDLSLPVAPDTLEGMARAKGLPLPERGKDAGELQAVCR